MPTLPDISTQPYQYMPPLSEDQYEDLKADIATRGVLVPIVLDDNGHILDGHHRLAVISELEAATPGLQIPYATEIRRNLTEDQKRDFVIALNLKRRHLSPAERLGLYARLRLDGLTAEEIGKLTETSTTTAWRRIQEAEQAGLTQQPAYIRAKDGRLLPSSYTPPSHVSHSELLKEIRTEERAVSRALAPANLPPITDRYQVFEADISDPHLPSLIRTYYPDGIDAIITDPPYPEEYLPLIDDLGRLAAAVLKPGRPLIAMLGHRHLPTYFASLSKHLTYLHTMANILGGPNATIHPSRAFVGWKPLLVFTNGPQQVPYYFLDTIKTPGPDKEWHAEWGQNITAFQLLTYRFTPPTTPAAVVLDPFLGGGTTIVAALSMHRRAIGFDIDPFYVNATLHRLQQTTFSDAYPDILTTESDPVPVEAVDDPTT